MSPARRAAFDILLRVHDGAFASDLLREARLAPRDAGLATELVLGCLRRQSQLDHLIRHFSGRDPAGLDLEVRIALRLGIYQLRHLDRIPPHAAVGESVELCRAARRASATGLVNAVLRKVTRAPVAWPTAAVGAGLPEWLHARWTAAFGPAVAAAAAEAALTAPATYIRVPPGASPPDGAEPTELPGCFRLATGSSPGPFRIADIGSQSLIPLLDLAPGHRFLDLCAAPGNKTAQALETPGIRAVACDISPRRMDALAGLACHRVCLDGTQPLPFGVRFDRILLDAPCSGTGTLARNPEIRWRLRPGDLARHQARQIRLLNRALECLAPGGLLVYSTCSLEKEENEAVVEQCGAAAERTLRRMPGRDPGDGFFAAVIKSRVRPRV